jgi:hypothetical protein
MQTNKLTCNSCNTTFNLETDGGNVERRAHPAGGLCNLETLCVVCHGKLSSDRVRIGAAELLLVGTGVQIFDN